MEKDNEVRGADTIKASEGRDWLSSCDSVKTIGAAPWPIRKRAFNRALRRGSLWLICSFAVDVSNIKYTFEKVIRDRNVCANTAYVTWPLLDTHLDTVSR